MDTMSLLGGIITNTPFWVFVLFALLIFLGVQAARPRAIRPTRALVTPAVFICWGLVSLATKPNFSALLAGDWLTLAVCGAALGFATVRMAGAYVDRATGLVHLPGSRIPVIRNVVIFLAKYSLAVAAAIAPENAAHLAYWDVAVSGLAAGYFFGWLARFALLYRAPAVLPESAR